MFDELQRALRQLGGQTKVSVPVPSDSEGYFDRECPSENCLFQFKVFRDDWSDKVRDEEVFCPFCGHTADAQKWWTQEQIEHAKSAALAGVANQINSAMRRDAERWNRSQPRNSFIKLTMNVDNRPRHIALPPAAAEPMQLKITCPACSCRYAVIGAAFFCPACGYNAAEQTFTLSLSGISRSLGALDEVRRAIPDRDTAENTVRLITENGLQNAVTAFQRYAEALYTRCPNALAARRNAFQNLGEGSDLWHAATGKRYQDHLGEADLALLSRAFQQRHLLAHTQGVVDQDYIVRSGDDTYRLGQRLVIRPAAVREAVAAIQKLATGIASDIPAPPP